MRFLGSVLIILGVVSAAVSFLDMEFIFLTWINTWGETIGWTIRGGFVLLGVILYIAGKPADEE